MFSFTFALAQFVVPVFGPAPATGVVGWPFPVGVVAWLILAALLGTLLGMLREYAGGKRRQSAGPAPGMVGRRRPAHIHRLAVRRAA